MTQKNSQERQQVLSVSALRSVACALVGCLVARAFFYPTWSEALGFAMVTGILFVVLSFTIDVCFAASRQDRQTTNRQQYVASTQERHYLTDDNIIERPARIVGVKSPPPLSEQESLDELKRFFVGPTSSWQQALEELSRRKQEAVMRHEQKVDALDAARRREDDEATVVLESQSDQLKFQLRNLQNAESGIRSLIAGIDSAIEELKSSLEDEKKPSLSQWDKPLVAKLIKFHGLVKRFPLTPPKEGEDVKLIHYTEQLEQAVFALNTLREKTP